MGNFDDEEMPPSEFPPEATETKPQKKSNGSADPTTNFPAVWVNDVVLKFDQRALIKGLWEQEGFTVIYGPSGSGKSFFTADIAQHIATGQAWRGRRVEQRMVVYVASEAGTSILKRFAAWRDNRLGEAGERVPLVVLTQGPSLLASVQIEQLIFDLKLLQSKSEIKLGLVIFDTLSRSIPGGDENEAKDMTTVVSIADILRSEFGCSTAFVHHTGKDETKGARGHSALHAAADLVMKISNHCAVIEKIRDGVSGEQFPFSLQPVVVGKDIDGDEVITCLLDIADQPTQKRQPKPTGKNQLIVFKELQALSGEAELSPGTSEIPKGARIVRYEVLADKAVPRFAGQNTFRAKARINEALTSLQSSNFIGVHNGFIWLL